MTVLQTEYLLAGVIGLLTIADVVFLIFFLKQRRPEVAVLPQFQAPLAELTSALVQLSTDAQALKNTADNAPSAQDLADTVAAVQAQADAAKALSAAVAPQALSAPVITG